MKLIIKLDPTFGQMLKTIKTKVNNLIYRWFKKPYNNYIQKRLEERRIKQIHEDFERKFGIKAEYLVGLMKRSDVAGYIKQPITKMSHEEHKQFLSEQLKKSAISFNEMRRYIKASFFYDPEICDIHNEALTEHTGPSLKELIARENKANEDILRHHTQKHPLLNISKPSTPSKTLNTRQTDLTAIKKADIQALEKEISQLKDLLPPPMSRKILE